MLPLDISLPLFPLDMPPPLATSTPTVIISRGLTTKDLGRFPLGNNRFVVVFLFNNNLKVHIREYEDASYPTKKGICLSPSRWAMLLRVMPSLDEEVSSGTFQDDYRTHLGGNVYARANGENGTVDIRQYFVPAGALKEIPTKKGITLRRFEWIALKGHLAGITRLSNELADARPCSDQQSHGNLEGFLACIECNPIRDTLLQL